MIENKTMDKLLPASKLYKALDVAGIASRLYAPYWFRDKQKSGKIKYPRVGREKRKFTQSQIDEIVKAFTPGGSGKWGI